jgi:hypothetical protein
VARRKAAARGKISIDKPFHKLMPGLGPHDAVELLNTAVRRKLAGLWCNGKEVDPGFFGTHLVLRARLMTTRRWTAEIEATRALDGPVEAYSWQMDAREIEALPTQPDAGGEAMQRATAAAEAARAEAATARAESEQARAVVQAATEQVEKAQARAEAAEARADAIASETTTRSEPEPEPRRRPGPKFKDDWPMLVAAETIRVARYEPEMLENLAALVAHMHNFLKEEIGWMADNEKEIRDKLRLLLNIKRK